MSEKVKHLKAALQLAEMHLEANPTDYNVEKMESAEREYQQALELEEVMEETQAEGSGRVAIIGAGSGKLVDLIQEQSVADKMRIQELEESLAEAKALLIQQSNEKAEKTDEAEKLALSGEQALPTVSTIPAAPTTPVTAPAAPTAPVAAPAKPAAAVKPAAKAAAAKPAAPAPEAEVKKN